jgi:hypothetical protein
MTGQKKVAFDSSHTPVRTPAMIRMTLACRLSDRRVAARAAGVRASA